MLIDTHCHIHEADYPDPEGAYTRALEADVQKMICVGTSEESSRQAIEFAAHHSQAWAAVGVHPHETQYGVDTIESLVAQHTATKVVAIGEIGLDYFYSHSPSDTQIAALEAQLQIAKNASLPVIFHVREAFDDFWPIFANFPGLKGVLHSFTDTQTTLETALEHGLFIGVNGISTFTKKPEQLAMFDAIPLEHMLLETDAPFLTPVPFRGTVNEPALVRKVAEFHAQRRGLSIEHIAAHTTTNAQTLFAI